ncbi:hypothetical protein BGZ94_009751 [Podila epigama]|nr:hypothetical protein BGZ94_009751 [Podila epigama]
MPSLSPASSTIIHSPNTIQMPTVNDDNSNTSKDSNYVEAAQSASSLDDNASEHDDYDNRSAFDDDQESDSSGSDSDSDNDSDGKKDGDRYRYSATRFTPEVDQEIIRLKAQNLSWTRIGSILALPPRACHRRFASVIDPLLHDEEFWTEERLQKLDEQVAQGKSWGEIGQVFGIYGDSCQAKWRTVARPKDKPRNRLFDTLQSKVLLQLVEKHGEHDWKLIMRGFMLQLGSRDMAKVTPEQLKHQYYRLQRKPIESWSLDDETILIQHVLKHGTGSWDKVADKIKTHTAEQCRERWIALDMHSTKAKPKAWYKAESSNFWRLWKRFGNDWKAIADAMPKRNLQQVKEYFLKSTEILGEENFEEEVHKLADSYISYNCIVWKKEDSEKLWEIVENVRKESKSGRVAWKRVAEKMELDLTPGQYKHHHYYLKMIKERGLKGAWMDEEIDTMIKAVQEVGRDWKLISTQYLPGRNPKSICHKYTSIAQRGNHISMTEYDALMTLVDEQEEKFKREASTSPGTQTFRPDWAAIARAMPGLWTMEHCRSAYEASFKSHLKTKWTPEEDETLLRASKQLGRKNWIGIATYLPNRQTWECRLRWSELNKPELKDEAATSASTAADGKDAHASSLSSSPEVVGELNEK